MKYFALLFVAIIFAMAFAAEQEIPAQAAGAPFGGNFRDQKDKARITTCIGPCLKKYPGVMEFIMKESQSM